MDVALKRIIHQLLLSFVSICELSIKVLHGHGKKFVNFLKVFAFNEDDGVKCELEKLKILAEKENQMNCTLTLELTKANGRKVTAAFAETNSTLGTIAESEKKREALLVAEKQFEKLKGALGNPEESYRDIYQSFLAIKLPNTGEWLQREPSFMSWADQQSDSEPILCISGNEGYGKSVLMSTIIQVLKKKYPVGQDDSRTSIAYYYFQEDVKSSQSSDRDHRSIVKALKALALQIAQNDPVYQRHLATSIKTSEDLSEVEHLWKNLFTNFSQIDATFFLLLDGIDQIDERHENILLQLLGDIQAQPRVKGLLRIRLFLSTRVDKLKERRKDLEKPLLSIDLARKNGDDIQKFVNFKLDNMKILKGSFTKVKKGLRDEIFAALTENAQGDFVNMDLLLNEIGSMQRPIEIRTVLTKAKAGENLSDTIARKIEQCNKLLGKRDIEDLNELLTWVINAYLPLTLRELEAVLYLKNKTSDASMEPLREQIQDRYSTFFRVSDKADPFEASDPVVTLVSDSIIDHFRKSTKTVDIEDSPADDSIEVKIIKKFLESVCDPDLFTRFGFKGFFEHNLAKNTAVITVDLHAAPLKLLVDCLHIINDEVDEMTEPLADHAALWFPKYLQQVDLSSADPTTKTAIGKQLLPLFNSNRHIERWWKEDDFCLRYLWLYNDNYVDLVLNWLKDAAVIKELTNEEKEWIKSLTSNSDLLMPLTKFLASKWLQSTDWGTFQPFVCVHSYIIKVRISVSSGR